MESGRGRTERTRAVSRLTATQEVVTDTVQAPPCMGPVRFAGDTNAVTAPSHSGRQYSAVTVVDESYRTARRVARAGIAVSGILACSNITIGLLAHSTSVLAMGFEFTGDVLASSIVVIGMGVAARPADENHPYGHGRFETLSAFVVGVILAAAGVIIGYQSL